MGKAKVIVKFTRVYEYPKAVLHKELFLQDAQDKARLDLANDMQEIQVNEFAPLDANFFNEVQVIDELGFKTRTPFSLEGKGRKRVPSKVDFEQVLKALTVAYMERKYGGPLDPDKNPDIFVHQAAQKNRRGEVISQECWYLREDIEREYMLKQDEYFAILSKLVA